MPALFSIEQRPRSHPWQPGGSGDCTTNKQGFFSGPIALLGLDTVGTISSYTVTINWGDGTSSPGTVTRALPLGTAGSWSIIGAGHP
jgi:hypothetical protein